MWSALEIDRMDYVALNHAETSLYCKKIHISLGCFYSAVACRDAGQHGRDFSRKHQLVTDQKQINPPTAVVLQPMLHMLQRFVMAIKQIDSLRN